MTTNTLFIIGGPNLHAIERNLMAPRIESAFAEPVHFDIVTNDGGMHMSVPLVLTRLQRLGDDSCALGAWSMRRMSFDPLADPPFQITNYSVQTRKGYVQVCDAVLVALSRGEYE